jgi:hypothetical protein
MAAGEVREEKNETEKEMHKERSKVDLRHDTIDIKKRKLQTRR